MPMSASMIVMVIVIVIVLAAATVLALAVLLLSVCIARGLGAVRRRSPHRGMTRTAATSRPPVVVVIDFDLFTDEELLQLWRLQKVYGQREPVSR